MRKFFVSLAVVVLAAISQACHGLILPGYEALGVVAVNQAMTAALAAQAVAPVQPFYPGYGNVPVCRLKDLQGLPQVSQPVIVRVSKSKGHRAADILGAATVTGGIVYINTSDWRATAVGAASGGGGGLLWVNHEPDNLCLYLPAPPKP